jgi:hypothetical protein
LLTLKILNPSKSPTGIRLKTAINAFQKLPKRHETAKGLGGTNAKPRKTADKTMLVHGPATDTFNTLLGASGPEIITAPGAKILNKGEIAVIKVITVPQRVNRNSAHNPSL